MVSKKLLIILLCLVTLTTGVGLVAFSYSWYLQGNIDAMTYELDADGFLIIYFDEDIDYSENILTPAVAVKGAIRNNQYLPYDPRITETNPKPSYIQTAAVSATYDAVLNYFNAEEDTVIDNDITINIEAKSTLPDNTIVPINLERELSIIISATIVDSVTLDSSTITVTPGIAFTIPPKSVITFSLNACIILPDELCDPALNEGLVTIALAVTSSFVE